ncbi:MAG TPA: hypothetical protein PLO99_04050 [Chitinophagaceae bacterium]|jgi:hypothetical protein|nr:hypothetical protein [Chitinophagaceae bacterium]HRG93314.1 hypothetical protein [Chitinophagaceae bacterium]
MKKLLILFFATSLFVACNNDKKDDRRSTRDREKEKDDYRSRDDEEKDDSRNTDYKDDERSTRDKDEDRDTRKSASGWPQSSKDEFVNSCVREAVKNGQTRSISERYCECMVEKMEALYPDVSEVETLTEDDINSVVNRYKDKCLE